MYTFFTTTTLLSLSLNPIGCTDDILLLQLTLGLCSKHHINLCNYSPPAHISKLNQDKLPT